MSMKTPTVEQLNDPGWWDENAPEGATHYDERYNHPWRKKTEFKSEVFVGEIDAWCHTDRKDDEGVPRPEPQPEWDEKGLPPVGVRIDVQSPESGEWSDAGEVTEIKTVVCTTAFKSGFSSTCKFRLAQIEKNRKELTAAVNEALRLGLNAQGISNIVWSRGFRKGES